MTVINPNGTTTSNLNEMKEKTVNYFTELFNSTGDTTTMVNLNLIPSGMITLEMNTKLCIYPTVKDIKDTLQEIAKNKSPGPDEIIVEIMIIHQWLIKEDNAKDPKSNISHPNSKERKLQRDSKTIVRYLVLESLTRSYLKIWHRGWARF